MNVFWYLIFFYLGIFNSMFYKLFERFEIKSQRKINYFSLRRVTFITKDLIFFNWTIFWAISQLFNIFLIILLLNFLLKKVQTNLSFRLIYFIHITIIIYGLYLLTYDTFHFFWEKIIIIKNCGFFIYYKKSRQSIL